MFKFKIFSSCRYIVVRSIGLASIVLRTPCSASLRAPRLFDAHSLRSFDAHSLRSFAPLVGFRTVDAHSLRSFADAPTRSARWLRFDRVLRTMPLYDWNIHVNYRWYYHHTIGFSFFLLIELHGIYWVINQCCKN